MKTDNLQDRLKQVSKQILRFRGPLFLVFVAIVYIFIIARVNTLKTAQPTRSAVAAQTTSSQPHIDQVTINKIRQLQDNSVSVQALFNQARQNPFQE